MPVMQYVSKPSLEAQVNNLVLRIILPSIAKKARSNVDALFFRERWPGVITTPYRRAFHLHFIKKVGTAHVEGTVGYQDGFIPAYVAEMASWLRENVEDDAWDVLDPAKSGAESTTGLVGLRDPNMAVWFKLRWA